MGANNNSMFAGIGNLTWIMIYIYVGAKIVSAIVVLSAASE